MSEALDALKAQVADLILAQGDTVKALDDLAAKLAAAVASNDTAALPDLTAQVKGAADALRAAVGKDDPPPAPAPSEPAPPAAA